MAVAVAADSGPQGVGILFDTSDFPQRWFCGSWTALHGWIHILSDAVTALAYFAIPALILVYRWRRPDVTFPVLFWLFGAFILFCGAVHTMEAIIFWWPAYRIAAVFKVGTAVVSLATLVALVRVLPRALDLPGMASINRELSASQASLQRLNGELKRSNGELEQFAYLASHDLQEPLRTVANSAELLREECAEGVGEDGIYCIDLMDKAVGRMQTLIRDLLQFSRIGRGQEAGDLESVDLAVLLQQIQADLGSALAEAGATISCENLPEVVGRATEMRLLFQNLLSNAIKFRHEERAPHIRVSAESVGEQWHIAVTDNGMGIAPEDRERIFEIFQTLNRRERFPGTGIGLAHCQRIVEYLGGRIWVEASTAVDGGGSTFRIVLPKTPVVAWAARDAGSTGGDALAPPPPPPPRAANELQSQ
ncbi:MAG: ATP-binding protein [Planctomycetota bacterium]